MSLAGSKAATSKADAHLFLTRVDMWAIFLEANDAFDSVLSAA